MTLSYITRRQQEPSSHDLEENEAKDAGFPAEEQQQEWDTLRRLASATPTSLTKPVIAVDLDDVLSQTNQTIAECKYPHSLEIRDPRTYIGLGHNEQYGSKMDLSLFYCKY
jgi:hypothetical protein